MRTSLAVVAVVCALPFFDRAWGPLRNVFGGYQDNAPVVYLLFALVLSLPGVALTALAFQLARRAGGRE